MSSCNDPHGWQGAEPSPRGQGTMVFFMPSMDWFTGNFYLKKKNMILMVKTMVSSRFSPEKQSNEPRLKMWIEIPTFSVINAISSNIKQQVLATLD